MLTKPEKTVAEAVSVADLAPKKPSIFGMIFRGVSQFVVMALILIAGYATMNWITALKQEPPSRPPFKTVYTVDSVTAVQGGFQPSFTVYGEVQPSKSVELRSLVAGEVIAVNPELKVGSRIEKGAELFRIDPFEYEKELALALSNINETSARIVENEARIAIEESRIISLREQFELARNDLERISSLQERGTATTKNVEDRSLIVSQRKQSLEQAELNLVVEKNRLKQLEATKERFEWAERQANRNIRNTVLLAPITSIVSQKNVSEGRLISANDMAVALYEADRLEVRFTLTDQRFGRIQTDSTGIEGRKVDVIWNVGGEEFRFPATIDRISAQITSDRGGVEVIAVLDDSASKSALRSGAFVQIIVPDRLFDDHFRVPESAIYDGDTVYIIVDGEITSKAVSVRAYDGDHVIVAGDIANGDQIMTTRIAEISNGLKVRPPDITPEQPENGDDRVSQEQGNQG